MSAKRTKSSSRVREQPTRGRADLEYLRNITEGEIMRTSPPELADLPADFWDHATLVIPPGKKGIYLRVDADVIEWFRDQGPRYQTRMNAVLRSFMERHLAPKRVTPRHRKARRKTSK